MKPARSPILVCLFGLHFASAWSADCNQNAQEDSVDIARGLSEDCNHNLRPDACELAPFLLELAPRDYPLDDTPQGLASGDFNGDGRTDVLSFTRSLGRGSKLFLFESDGAAGFAEGRPTEIGTRAYALALGDLDGDGDLDVATANVTDVRVFLNRGDGAFEPAGAYVHSPDAEWRFVSAGDIDGDGTLDLIAANRSAAAFAVLRNRGGGTFAPETFEAGQRPEWIATADFDGDAKLDLVLVNRGSREVSVHLQRDGRFPPLASLRFEAAPRTALADDLDGDGAPDLIVQVQDSTFVYLNQGDGSFSQPALYEGFDRPAIRLDFDGDGDLDLAVGVTPPGVLLRANDGRGRFDVSFRFPAGDFSRGSASSILAAGDFDDDGLADLATNTTDALGVYFQREGKPFPVTLLEFRPDCRGFNGGRPPAGNLVDLDGDGDLDAVASVPSPAQWVAFLNDGAGHFTPQPPYVFGIGGQPLSMAVGNLDGDGDMDLVTVDSGDHQLYFHYNGGAGDFDPPERFPVGRRPVHVRLADFDGDGALDAVSANFAAGTVSVLFNRGERLFAPAGERDYPVGASPSAVAVDDLDGDGSTDIAAANRGSATISVLLGRGDGSFRPRVDYPVRANGMDVANFLDSADLDGDGDVDLVSASRSTSSAGVFLNRGDGTFGDDTEFRVGRPPYSIAVVDFDRDGVPDLVTADETTDTVSLLYGRGDGSFEPGLSVVAGRGLRWVFPADLDGDSDSDLLTLNRGGASISVLLNEFPAPVQEEYLEWVCTPLDFHNLSAAVGAAKGRLARYLLPVREEAGLLPALFENAKRFRLHQDFLTRVFPDRFPVLSGDDFSRLVARRATRDYYAGSITRVVSAGAVLYGFDVLTEAGAPSELLTVEETRSVLDGLRSAFRLEPLVYAPATPEARERATGWVDPGFPVLSLDAPEEPEPEGPPATPTFELEIPPGTVLCGVSVVAGDDRGLPQEYALKSRLHLRGGIISLPTASERFGAELFEQVLFGPRREVAEPQGEGEFRVLRLPGEVTTYRFTYTQVFRLSSSTLELAIVSPLQYRARGDEPVEKRRELGEEFFVALKGLEPLQGSLDGAPLVRYGSCGYETLPRWEIRARLEDSTELCLTERYDEAESFFATGPASLVRAEVKIAGGKRLVTDYFDLVDSAGRHHTKVDYWVILEPPVNLEGRAGAVHGIELRAPEPELNRPLAAAAYLGADLEPMAAVAVVSFSRKELKDVPFRRGDGNGDGRLNLADALSLLQYLFARGEPLACGKAADSNDDGRLNLADAISIVTHLFAAGDSLPQPFPDCGLDPSSDELTCRDYVPCP